MISRAKEKFIFPYKGLTSQQLKNTKKNISEMEKGHSILESYPRRIVIELTNACNMNCKMCGRNHKNFKIVNLSFDILHCLCQILDKSEEVTLMGWGEPTIYPDFLDVLSLIDKYPIKKYICTNGMKIKEINRVIFDYHIDLFAVSINGVKRETNDLVRVGSKVDDIFSGIQSIVDYKEKSKLEYPYISIVFCLSEGNLLDLYQLVDIARFLHINKIKIVYLTAFEKEQEKDTILSCISKVGEAFYFLEEQCDMYGIELELPYLPGEDPSRTARHHECTLPWRDLFIGSDGWIRPCMSTSDKLFKVDVHKSFMDVWNSIEFQMYRKNVNNEAKMPISCYYCYQASFCNWNMRHAFCQQGYNSVPEWRIE